MDEKINFKSVKYINDEMLNRTKVALVAFIEEQDQEGNKVEVRLSVPIAEGNRHYDEIMKQVEAGELTIEEAD
tara:strand:+ start:1203 stop:1421 length:219 start_codon:yes stop_codon:yes gene_type:complete